MGLFLIFFSGVWVGAIMAVSYVSVVCKRANKSMKPCYHYVPMNPSYDDPYNIDYNDFVERMKFHYNTML